MKQSNSKNLSVSDIISVVALLILGVTVFFGVNFMTLGNKIPSIVIAVLLFIIMMVFVFLAAHAKAQDRNQETWKKVEYIMLVLYIIALIPCYMFSAKFFDIQMGKQEIVDIVNKDVEDINNMFTDYTKKCKSRSSNFQTELEALLKSDEGREQIVKILDLKEDGSSVNQSDIEQASKSFSDFLLKGSDISSLMAEKKELVENCETNFKNWNILFIPQHVSELGDAKKKYAKKLEEIYSKKKNALEKETPSFDTSSYVNESNIKDKFSTSSGFSVLGLIAIIILGALGLVKYLLGEKSTVIPMKNGSANTITEDGGYTF